MGAEVLTAVLGGAALTYSMGRLLRAHRRENRRERELARRAADLDARDGGAARVPATLSAFQEGYLAGLVQRRAALQGQASEHRTPATTR